MIRLVRDAIVTNDSLLLFVYNTASHRYEYLVLVGRLCFVNRSQTSHVQVSCRKFYVRERVRYTQSRIAINDNGLPYLLLPLASGEGLF